MIYWDTDYSLSTEQYTVNYKYLENKGDVLITLAKGNKTNSSFVHQDFPHDSIDANPHLTPKNMESHSIEMSNLLITKWNRIFELAGIDKEKLIEEL